MENPKQLSTWSLCLPACRISESVQQLMELALNTLCEAVGSSTQWYVTVLGDQTGFCIELLYQTLAEPNFCTTLSLHLISIF